MLYKQAEKRRETIIQVSQFYSFNPSPQTHKPSLHEHYTILHHVLPYLPSFGLRLDHSRVYCLGYQRRMSPPYPHLSSHPDILTMFPCSFYATSTLTPAASLSITTQFAGQTPFPSRMARPLSTPASTEQIECRPKPTLGVSSMPLGPRHMVQSSLERTTACMMATVSLALPAVPRYGYTS